ncbi:MAG: histidine kinase [Bacteroidales bacterium]|nr:histidine kinase [Bacteroidales bacterium]MCF8336772.1 histidine kinase [Bacteroidales bacterium]
MRRFIYIGVLILSMVAYGLRAQLPYHIHYTVNDGLPGSEVYDIVQDSTGRLWLGTSYGVSRYNGYTFENYTVNDGLADNSTVIIYKTNDRLWFYSYEKNFSYYKNGKFHIPKQINNTLHTRIHPNHPFAVTLDNANNLYFISKNNRLVRMDTARNITKIDTLNKDLNHYSLILKKFDISHRGEYLGSLKKNHPHLYRYLSDNPYFTRHSDLHFYQHRQKAVSNEKLSLERIKHPGKLIQTVHPKDLGIDSDGSIWIRKTIDGLLYFKKRGKSYMPCHFLKNKRVTRIYRDREKNYWISTEGNGLYRIPSLQFNVFHTRPEMSSENIISMEIYDSLLFCGTNNNHLYKIRIQEGYMNNPRKILKTRNVKYPRDIFIDKNNSIWLIESDFLHYTFDGRQNAPDYIIVNKIYCASRTLDSGVLMATNRGFLKYKNNHLVYDSRKDGFNQHLHAICQTSDSVIWGGGLNGLFKIHNHNFSYKGNEHPLLAKRISLLVPDGRKLWIGTRVNGLVCYTEDTLLRITKADGLCSNIIKSFYKDNDTTYWVGTSEGLNRLVFDGKTLKTKKIEAYTIWNGLPSNVINDIARQSQHLWLATSKGLASVNPEELTTKKTHPILHIDSMVSGGQKTEQGKPIHLEPAHNNLTIYYTGVSLISTKNITYKVKLEGRDSQWITTQNRSVRYADLAHGDYQFKLKARYAQGTFTPKALSIRIHVEKHFTETTWFLIISILTALIVMSGISYAIIRFKAQKEQDKREIIQSEQKALRAQMNPHFIFNSLNSIQEFVLEQKEDEAERYLSSFSSLMRDILEYSKKNFIWLADELKMLRLYLELEQLRFDESFDFDFQIDDNIEPSSIQIPPILLQPFAENAIRHGLLHKKEKGHIRIHIAQGEEDTVILSISDNGVGRKRAAQIESSKRTRKAMGMKNTLERLQLINKIYNAQIATKITDNYHDDGSPAGTTIKIYIPESIGLKKKFKTWKQRLTPLLSMMK